jgi:hypothetical protein
MAIYTVQKELPKPSWQSVFGKDIRKLPVAAGKNRLRASSWMKAGNTDRSGISSGPSSTDNAANSSVFSSTRGQSSATSDDPVITGDIPDPFKPQISPISGRKKKYTRFQVPQRDRRLLRPWQHIVAPTLKIYVVPLNFSRQ